MDRRIATLLTITFAFSAIGSWGQTGTAKEPVRYIGGEIANPNVQDGALRYAVGTENIQVLRANRTNPQLAEDFGWTYNHAPNLTYWNGRFYLQYLSNPVNEHEDPGHTLIATSTDGRNWGKPIELFPPYKAPQGVTIPEGYNGYMMHQRMGFYTAPNGRLLTLAFYGHTNSPFKQGGIGRVVREVYKDGSFGPIYFIRYSSHTQWNQSNTSYPFYKESPDKDFVKACDALLADKLKTLQWHDEDRGLDGFYDLPDSFNNIEAVSYYHRNDGNVVGLWKKSFATLSKDNGLTWSEPKQMPTLIMAGGKNWGQRTVDGRYAMSYNPIETQEYRFPLIVTSSEDGILFDNMSVVHGEVPLRRFYGLWKDFGPCYMRGITEGEATPPTNDMWLTYSVNKEDIWISRIPLPIRTEITGNINDNFDNIAAGAPVTDWNIYSPQWAKVYVEDMSKDGNMSLRLEDEDPYDYARAIRVFETSENTEISFKVRAAQNDTGTLQVEVTDRYGNRPIRIIFDHDGVIKIDNGTNSVFLTNYEGNKWYSFQLKVSAEGLGKYDLIINETLFLKDAPLAEAVKSFERISFRTGEYRNIPNRKTPNQVPCDPLPGADNPTTKAIFNIDDVRVENLQIQRVTDR